MNNCVNFYFIKEGVIIMFNDKNKNKVQGQNGQVTKQNIDSILFSLILTEKDFYPPEDNRCLTSGVDDIRSGDNFAEYTEYYFRTYIEED